MSIDEQEAFELACRAGRYIAEHCDPRTDNPQDGEHHDMMTAAYQAGNVDVYRKAVRRWVVGWLEASQEQREAS